MMQESIARKERLLKVGIGSVDDSSKVSSLLIDSIQAKLAILNRLNSSE